MICLMEYFEETAYDDSPQAIVDRCLEEIEEGRPTQGALQAALAHAGVAIGPDGPGFPLFLGEAINLAAKRISSTFYRLKAVAAQMMAEEAYVWGWGAYGVWYAWHPDSGEVSFHDPFGEIEQKLGVREYPYQWSGEYRQDLAFESLKCLATRRVVAKKATPQGIEPYFINSPQEGQML